MTPFLIVGITAFLAAGLTMYSGFGLGTLPMLLLMGGAADQLSRFVRSPQVRMMAGLIIISLGVYMLWAAFQNGPHIHHH